MSTEDNLRADLAATATYTTMMVQTRFTTAALFLAAQSFILAALVADIKWEGKPILIPILGLLSTIAVWLLELRTEEQLHALVEHGSSIEGKLFEPGSIGLFGFFRGPQKAGIRIPFLRKPVALGKTAVHRYLFSHTFALEILYVAFIVFWLNAVWVAT